MSEKSWSDQPQEVESAVIVIGALKATGANIIEVRKVEPSGPYYVTHGSLFASQTVRCVNADVVLKVIAESMLVSQARSRPEGCELLECAK